jgi:hypothetical protein
MLYGAVVLIRKVPFINFKNSVVNLKSTKTAPRYSNPLHPGYCIVVFIYSNPTNV